MIWVYLGFAFLGTLSGDPSPNMLRSKDHMRTLECERMTADQAGRDRPGQITKPKPRGDFADRDLMVCTQRLMRPGLRAARDEAILSTLAEQTSGFAQAARAFRPELEQQLWMVEVHYPDLQVAGKISFATKNGLMSEGLMVSDRVPMLGYGDIGVITRLSPEEAYPAACQRYLATGSMSADDVLLAVISRDRRETALHAGVCTNGHWTWLR